jgi:hypothetical protein
MVQILYSAPLHLPVVVAVDAKVQPLQIILVRVQMEGLAEEAVGLVQQEVEILRQ